MEEFFTVNFLGVCGAGDLASSLISNMEQIIGYDPVN